MAGDRSNGRRDLRDRPRSATTQSSYRAGGGSARLLPCFFFLKHFLKSAVIADFDLGQAHLGHLLQNPIWSANIVGQDDDCYLGLKPNGELVVRRGVHYTLWSSSRKFKKGNYALELDGNGRLGIYGQRRWTSSNQKELGLLDGSTFTMEYVLFSGDRLMPPRKLKYKNYGVEFMRCNLVIKDDQSGRFLWQTSTDACSCYARQETDGELTVKHKGERLGGSNSKGSNGPYIAVLRFDGRLNVFGPLRWTHDGHHDSLYFLPFKNLMPCCGHECFRFSVSTAAKKKSRQPCEHAYTAVVRTIICSM